jgi:hypothetical protein
MPLTIKQWCLHILSCLLMTSNVAWTAEIKSETSRNHITHIEIKGLIGPPDVSAIYEAIVEANRSESAHFMFRITSTGGNVIAAMEIGRLIRSVRGSVQAVGTCVSACVLVLASGINKGIYARNTDEDHVVGIHRPYFSTLRENADYLSVRTQVARMDSAIRTYLEEMNIPTSLLEAMKAVPPEQIRWLNEKELKQFGLEGLDPIEQELRDVQSAKNLGIPRHEYNRRQQLVEALCNEPKWSGTPSEKEMEVLDKKFLKYLECRQRVLVSGK